MTERRRRATATGLVVAISGLLALGALVLAAGGGAGRPGSSATGAAPSSAPALAGVAGSTSTPTPNPTAVSNRRPRGGRTELAMALHHWLAEAGPQSGVMVSELSTGRVIYARNGSVARPPASVEKLYTSVALLQRLGPNFQLHTDVLGFGHLGRRGVWVGDLYLRGDGDPTFGSASFNRIWIRGQGATVEALAGKLARAGIRGITGRVIADASLFDALRGGPGSGYRADFPDLAGELSALTYNHGAAVPQAPEVIAAQALAHQLRQAGGRASAATRTTHTPPGAGRLASVSSPPLRTLLRLMDVSSDDLYAELLTKTLGARFAHAGTTAAGARVISRTIADLGLRPAIVDGSGLSRQDRSSPAQVVQLLTGVSGTSIGRALRSALPVVGRTGTVQRIGAGTRAVGRCQAKTGTLSDVTNLAGYCRAGGEHAVAFTVFIQGQSDRRGYTLLGHMVGDIARLDPDRP